MPVNTDISHSKEKQHVKSLCSNVEQKMTVNDLLK